MKYIQVLLIEDDPMVCEVNRQFIERVKGFKVIGTASNGLEGLEKIQELKPDLVFMDIFMPKQDGLLTLKEIREKALTVDVIAVTAANDVKTVQQVLSHGAFDYIMKPFQFERMKQALDNYSNYRSYVANNEEISQEELDKLLKVQKKANDPSSASEYLPKGLNAFTLDKIIAFIGSQQTPVSAEEVAEGVGLARVTARRYLDFLEKQKQVKIVIEYGGVGRPVNRYISIKNSGSLPH